ADRRYALHHRSLHVPLGAGMFLSAPGGWRSSWTFVRCWRRACCSSRLPASGLRGSPISAASGRWRSHSACGARRDLHVHAYQPDRLRHPAGGRDQECRGVLQLDAQPRRRARPRRDQQHRQLARRGTSL
ncbi:MAG: hypothetical protein AVDCRST_MAG27-3307, partial [uncultured Craurococcus sp.]